MKGGSLAWRWQRGSSRMRRAGFSPQLAAVPVERPDPSLQGFSCTPRLQPTHRDPASLCTGASNCVWSFPWSDGSKTGSSEGPRAWVLHPKSGVATSPSHQSVGKEPGAAPRPSRLCSPVSATGVPPVPHQHPPRAKGHPAALLPVHPPRPEPGWRDTRTKAQESKNDFQSQKKIREKEQERGSSRGFVRISDKFPA